MSRPISIVAKTDIPLFFFGDHASNHIPRHLNNLELSGDDLTRHIAWDIGTAELIERLSKHFLCGAQLAGVSRLVIDFNRAPEAEGLIPGASDGTRIAANQGLSLKARAERIAYYDSHHSALSARIMDLPSDPLIMSLHSFTRHPKMGAPRETEIGILHKADEKTTRAALAGFETLERKFNVAINKPYSAFDLNYTVDSQVIARGLRHLTLEIRQDLLDSDDKVEAMAQLLIKLITPLI